MFSPEYSATGQAPPQNLGQHVGLPAAFTQGLLYSFDQSPPSMEADSPVDARSATGSHSNENGKRPAPTASASSESRKKARTLAGDGGSPEEDVDHNGTAANGEGKAKSARGSRACTVCRRLKMRCVVDEVSGGEPCKRCAAGGYECRFEESNRGKRSAKKSEQFQRTLKKMERTIATVLHSITSSNPLATAGAFPQIVSRSPSPQHGDSPAESTTSSALRQAIHFSPKLNTLPDNVLNPLGLLAEASLSNQRISQTDDDNSLRMGVANDTYFKPGPMTILPLRRLFIERQVQPEMLTFTSTDEVVALFDIFFDKMNHHAPLLDREFHTPSLVCSRSPFLLTTICAIAAKYMTIKPDLHARLESLAKKLAFTVPERGYKSVEIVQAYLLLALWGTGPTERYEQDKTWMLIGMGIRMATDLNLHRKSRTPFPPGSAQDKEARNRERAWVMCFIMDRSSSGQLGKPYCITDESMIRGLSQWYRHPYALPTDPGLAAYAEVQRLLSRSLDFLYAGYNNTNSELQSDNDYLLVVKTIEAQFMNWRQDWDEIQKNFQDGNVQYRASMGRFYWNYAALVINSFGLQNALERSGADMGHFFGRCHFSAMTLLAVVRDELAPSGALKYSPDPHFVQISYAVLTLLKLLRPDFRSFFESEDNTIAMIKSIPDLLESVAAGPLHTAALYATFLRALITVKLEASSAQTSDGPTSAQRSNSEGANQSQNYSALLSQQPGLSQQHQQPQMHLSGQPPAMADQHYYGTGASSHSLDYSLGIPEFQFSGEMGPVADLSTFPPTMVDSLHNFGEEANQLLTMDSILGDSSFWDNVLVPGYSGAMEGLSGGFVFGPGGSGLITPRVGASPIASGVNTPTGGHSQHLTQTGLNMAFGETQ
ncbi:fungal-specific transcription factor domain-containing protein [Auriculariales sp. MPI-PUGE-AT-0066]|nr:fungal-specific transcription factor domain-containing protein [Auriculariales sp. MPI-PUGE-AT-0066]